MRNRIGVLITIFTFMLFLGIKHEIMAATTVPVTNFEEFKTWCEKPEDCDIWLTSNIAIQQSVRVVGNKKIYGSNNYYIDNWLLENGHVVANEPNACLYILSGSNCTFYDIKYINGRNTSTNTSSAVVVYGGGTLTVNNTNFCYTAQGIHVDNGAVLNFNSGSIWGTSYAGIGSYRGNVYFNDGTIASDGQGLHNNGGNLNLIDGTISGKSIGLFTTGGGISNVKGGVIDSAQHGINNVDNGTVNIIGGKIRNNVYGIYNSANLNVKGGEIHNNSKVQIFNESKAVVSGGTMYSGSRGIENVGNLTVSGGIIRNHTAENGAGIYHNGSSCTITGGTFEENQDVYLAADDKFVITNESTPTFVVKPNTYTRGRKVVQTSSASNAINELSYLTLFPNSDWRLRAVNEDIRIWNKSTITINYLDESGEKLAESVIKEDWVDEEYTTSAKTISRYRVKSIPTNASGKYTDEEITINYVYEEDESEIEIQYVDKYTGTVLNTKTVKGIVGDSYTITPETIEGYESENLNDIVVEFERGKQIVLCNYVKVSKLTISYIDLNNENTKLTEDIVLNLKQKDTYTTEAKIFNGYTLTQQPTNKTVTMERDNITVTYGYKKNSLGVEVKYIDKFTGSEVATKITKTGLVGDTFTTSAKTVSGYELVTSPENSAVTMTEAKITLIYEYAKVSTITVKYIDLTNSNAKLADDIVVSKKQGETYTTEAKTFNGYTLIQQPINKTVTVERDNITVTYGYKKNSLGVEVKYIDKFTGTNIYETVTGTGFVGDTFIVEEKEKAGYEIVARPDSTNITMTESKITVTYEYAKLSNVKVIYKDITSNVDIETSIKEYKQGDKYTTTLKEFEGYVLSKTPTNNEGTVEREDITVIYEYKRTGKGVTIKYIDRSTKTDLVTPIIKTGNVGDAYTSEAKTIEGYELVKTPTNANGNIAEEAQEVIYEYAKVSTLTISYIDLTNSNVTLVDNIVEKLKEGDTYTLEAKTFNGYTLVEEPENNVVTMERKNITITYGYKKNSLGVEVKYIDKFTGSEVYPTVTQTGFVGDAFTVEEKEKAGYEIVTRPDSTNITMTESKIIVTYEYAKVSTVTVSYIDLTNSNAKLTEDVVVRKKQGETYTTEAKTFSGYTLTQQPTNKTVIVERDNITVTYGYKKNSLGVEVKYIDKFTGSEVATKITKTGLVGDTFTTSAKNVSGYELVTSPENSTVTMTESKITLTYEYAKVSTITVKYIDLTNSNVKLADDIVVSKKQGETYTTEAKSFNGYTLTQQPENKIVTVERDNITVTYGYKKNSLGVEVKYIDKFTGSEVYPTVTQTGFVGDTFTVEEKEKAGYEIVTRPDSTNITMTESKITVTYEYAKLSNVKVIYKDITSNVDIETSIKEYKQGDKYTTTSKEFEGYVLSKTPTNNEGTVGREDITVIYEYKRTGKGVKIKYIDRSTKTDLVTPITKTGNVGDAYTSEAKTIEGYELVKTPTNANGNIAEEAQEVIYEYAKVSTLTISYIDLTNSNVTLVDNIVEKLKEGDTYTLEAKTFNGYTLVEEPENNVVTMERKNITITYGYKKDSLGVEVKYIDKFTGSEIYPTVTQTGFVGDTFTVEEKAGYEIVTRPDSTNITMTESKITVTYEYAKLSNVKVIYKDITSNVDIETSIKEYKQGDKYTTTSKEFEGYVLSKTPTNNEGTVGREDITVIYEYKRTGKGVTIKYIDRSTKTDLVTPIIKTGNVGDAYTSEAKKIEGYELVKTPTNANGNIAEEAQEVIYEYAKVSTLTISYIDLTNSNETLVDNIVEKLKEGDTYTLEAKTFNGYTLVEEPENNVVTMERKNITITYGYKKNSLGVEVKYIDKFTGSEIYPTVTKTGFVGDAFTVEEKEKAGYEIVTRPDSINITMIEDKITVTYEYAKVSTLTVKYVDENNKELAETISSKLKQGDNYTTEEKDIKNYEVILITGNKTGTMGDKDIEIVYTYKIVEGKIIVTKVDKNNSSKLLSGAKFKIEKTDEFGNIDTTFTSQEKETGTNGKLEFIGLLIGKYIITEIEAPEGYILENGIIEVEITRENKEINILAKNKLSVELPETGSKNNSIIISIIGLSLMIIVCGYIKLKKKIQ